jgi:hypothetical protein
VVGDHFRGVTKLAASNVVVEYVKVTVTLAEALDASADQYQLRCESSHRTTLMSGRSSSIRSRNPPKFRGRRRST